MAGYVMHRTYTTIRPRIFLRARRQYIRAKADVSRNGYVPVWRSYKLVSYNGYFDWTKSRAISEALKQKKLFTAAKVAIRVTTQRNAMKKVRIEVDFLISPYKGTFRVSQAYRNLRANGTYHQGYDLVGIGDKSIYCPVYGTVIRAGWECATLPKKGFGQRVVVRIGSTAYYMYFGHLSKINVAVGQKLKPGDLIGVEGSTGHSTGSHLHWEIRINDISTGYVSVHQYAGIPNVAGSTAYTSNWVAELFGPSNLKKSTSGFPQRLYNSVLQGALGIDKDGIFGANS